jgi:hypothetical protein
VADVNANSLENLILVAGHAVYVGRDLLHPDRDENWFLQPFQKGEPPFYLEHIRKGVELAANDVRSLVVFSGGQTRREAGPRSEAQSYWILAEHFEWWSAAPVSHRSTTEEFARDSFENLIFGICRFNEFSGRYPSTVTVVSWAFKQHRFELHREALRFPASRFIFCGVNQPVDLLAAQKGETKAIAAFKTDPYGTDDTDLGKKRMDRNPFNRCHPYSASCPEARGILQHTGPDLYAGEIPWN